MSIDFIKMKKFLLALGLTGLISPSFSQVLINEVQSSNNVTINDFNGDSPDWVELYNNSTSNFNAQGHYLSDDASDLTKWQIPAATMAAQGHLILFASGKDTVITATNEIHTNFKIKASGESIFLTSPDGFTVIDSVSAISIPTDQSYGRDTDGSANWIFFNYPTPNSTNGAGANPNIYAPGFSHTAGLYTTGFDLSLTKGDPSDVILYTTNGDDPKTSGQVYSSPISIYDRTSEPNGISTVKTTIPNGLVGINSWHMPNGQVFKANVIRAVAINGTDTSNVITSSYFIEPGIFSRYNVPILSIATDSVNLFGNQKGIYVPGDLFDGTDYQSSNYFQRGSDWERPIHLEVFESDSNYKRVIAQNCGVRVAGFFSRTMNVKSLRLYARSEYGKSRIKYPFFKQNDEDHFKRLTIRTSGNDAHNTLFRDLFANMIYFHNRDKFDIMEGRQGVLFINGEFWGVHNLRRRFDKNYLENKYGLDENEIDLIEVKDGADEGDEVKWDEMIDFITTADMTLDASYEKFTEYVDLQNFADILSLEIFISNGDWPQNNNKYWRKRTAFDPTAPYGHDGRFRWMFYDSDLSLGKASYNVGYNMLQKVLNNNGYSTEVFRYTIGEFRATGNSEPGNEKIRHYFLQRFCDQLNSSFLDHRLLPINDSLQMVISPIISEHTKRHKIPPTVSHWNTFRNVITTFIESRQDTVYKHLLDRFGLGDTSYVHLDVSDINHGKVKVNTIVINDQLPGVSSSIYPWSGRYFHNVPTQLVAIPEPGYVFKHWLETGVTDDTLLFNLGGDTTLTAVFEYDSTYINPDAAWDLAQGAYELKEWNNTTATGTHPPFMKFVQSRVVDPVLADDMIDPYTLPYNNTSRSRINGLNADGFSFINTGTSNDLVRPEYDGRDLGAAIVAINTMNQDSVHVRWIAGTVKANDKKYAVRVQYRIGKTGPFIDVLDNNNAPLEYTSEATDGHFTQFGYTLLPDAVENHPYVQIRWKYYFVSGLDGKRAEVRLDNLYIGKKPVIIDNVNELSGIESLEAYPNPFNDWLKINVTAESNATAQFNLYDIQGKKMMSSTQNLTAGNNEVRLTEGMQSLPKGIYILQLSLDQNTPEYVKLIKE